MEEEYIWRGQKNKRGRCRIHNRARLQIRCAQWAHVHANVTYQPNLVELEDYHYFELYVIRNHTMAMNGPNERPNTKTTMMPSLINFKGEKSQIFTPKILNCFSAKLKKRIIVSQVNYILKFWFWKARANLIK